LNAAINDLRKGRKAESGQAEESLRRPQEIRGDLTAAAQEGKLDPVIGRDEEIRRTHPGAGGAAPRTIPS